jgi:hypothetical protein
VLRRFAFGSVRLVLHCEEVVLAVEAFELVRPARRKLAVWPPPRTSRWRRLTPATYGPRRPDRKGGRVESCEESIPQNRQHAASASRRQWSIFVGLDRHRAGEERDTFAWLTEVVGDRHAALEASVAFAVVAEVADRGEHEQLRSHRDGELPREYPVLIRMRLGPGVTDRKRMFLRHPRDARVPVDAARKVVAASGVVVRPGDARGFAELPIFQIPNEFGGHPTVRGERYRREQPR